MHVGVFLMQYGIYENINRLPHACGGVSPEWFYGKLRVKSSPCMWGCFLFTIYDTKAQSVFPMHVGVFLQKARARLEADGLPHACGGVSILVQLKNGGS